MVERCRHVTAILPGERPDPPEDMPADEAEVWRAVVDSMSPDWFRPSIQHLLEQYCHYACKARTTMLQSRRTQDPDTLKKLTVIGAKQTAIMLSFATKLRITVQ